MPVTTVDTRRAKQRAFSVIYIPVLLACLTWAHSAAARGTNNWDLTGGPPWENRTGPGIMIAVGGNDCTDEHCDDMWDTSFFGSIAGTIGFFYRIIPNLVLLVDIHFGYVNTDMKINEGRDKYSLDDDSGFLFQAVGGAEFHGPITGWLDAYVGLGIGFSLLNTRGDKPNNSGEYHESLRGVNFELRTGVDIYPFSRIPTFGTGPFFRLGLPYWAKGCIQDGNLESCNDPDDMSFNALPFLVHFGLAFKYGF
ncbi:MAG: hypothetical protein GY847_20785 [Proteobacteria bacterium]|nr:hypothetical protein [Pseudomonadota bacterium]